MTVSGKRDRRRGIRREERCAPESEDVGRIHVARGGVARHGRQESNFPDRVRNAYAVRPAAERVELGHQVGGVFGADRMGLEVDRPADGVGNGIGKAAGTVTDFDSTQQNGVNERRVEAERAVANSVDRMAVDEHLRLVGLGAADRQRRVRAGLVRAAAHAIDLNARDLVEQINDLVLPLATDGRRGHDG